mgnify:CR=1 FL=1|tara:strand:+ start:2637 stop:3941 length:1305 start_codon:yes stop_codon:yes gene_type:complete
MRPTAGLLTLILIWGLTGLVASFVPIIEPYWLYGGAGVGLLSLLDMLTLATKRSLKVSRSVPSRFALGVAQDIELTITNNGFTKARVSIFDGIPADVETDQMPWKGAIPRRGYLRVSYSVKPLKRGQLEFGEAHLLRASPLRLWNLSSHAAHPEVIRVYPNYEPIIEYSLLALEHMETKTGIKYRNRQGMSREFHQLRDYQDGDVLNQIDWKATARRRELISRQYREQRDQNLIVMIDSGRRMRAVDGDLPQFDHCLNATLLMAFIALRQGDKMGVLSFGGTNRWLPPIKGQHGMTEILNHLYDYQTSREPSDFGEAVERLMTYQRRRALVVVLTNLRSEDASDVIPSLQALHQRHLVMLASLREKSVQDCISAPIRKLDDALLFGSTHHYLEERRNVFEELHGHGIVTIDAVAEELPIALTNAYLEVKRSGRL